jgi:tryptophan synthase alpha chain
MNRINRLFEKNKNILTMFFTAGFPSMEDTIPILNSLQKGGVDMIEIGIPFSDPVADGPVIQKANLQAIENGMTVEKLFKQLENFRNEISVPVVIMSSFNPILQFGVEAFCEQCKTVGIDGLIIPDMPTDFYENNYHEIFIINELININLVTPTTSIDRIKMIDKKSTGFIYLVSSSNTTGGKGVFSEEQKTYFKGIKNLNLKNPVLTGFGISNHESFETVCAFTNGGIIGSAFVNALFENGISPSSIQSFINEIRR